MKFHPEHRSGISTPICDFVQEYAASGISRFHMPGHKGAFVFPGLSMQGDITEIQGADCLYAADGIIRESECNAAMLFGSGATFYSTEGSSQCIRAMLALVTDSTSADDRDPSLILAVRNVHRSFLTAAALLDLDVKWLYPEPGSTDSICSCPVTADQVCEALSEMDPLPAAVYLTSPDYLGAMQDIKGIAEAAHAYAVPLLVDNAHGAYLHFLEQAMHPIDLGVDLCCDSAHKTLPALTGCAYLHISKKAAPFYAARARKALSLFGSTSPSWLLLSSLDHTNQILAGDFRERLTDCTSRILDLKKTYLPGQAGIAGEPLKITIPAAAFFQSGKQIADQLREKHHIESEYADQDYVVLMVSPYNTQEDMDRLESALKDMASGPAFCSPTFHTSVSCKAGNAPDIDTHPTKAMSIRRASLAPSKKIPVDQASGQICADLSLSCPPGIPVIVCGEIISDKAINTLKHYGISEIDVISAHGS